MATANGWRVLCLDGGGTRGIVPLAVLQSLKNRTHKEPWEIFDIIVGTSTGGILAVLLGLLKVPVEECIKIYEKLGATVFEPPMFGKVQKSVSTLVWGHCYSATPLENVVKEILTEYAGNKDITLDALGPDSGARPHVVLVANRDGFGQLPYRFANFTSDDDDGNTLTNKVRVWEAVRATSAAPTYFEPMQIDIPGVGHGVKFYDGGVKYNNPIEVARTLLGQHPFEGKPPSLFVSLGTGMNIFKMGDVDSLSNTLNTMVRAATDSEAAHEHAWQQLQHAYIPYFRFNPGEGLGDLPMDSVAFVEHMRNATQKYLVSQDAKSKMKVLVTAVENEALKPTNYMMPPMRSRLMRREDKIKEIKDALLSETPGRLVLVWGMGGVGKTTLARQVVDDPDVRSHFRDGLLWVSLGGQASEARVLTELQKVAYTQGLGKLDDAETATAALRRRFGDKACLLVVDDVWQTELLEAFDVMRGSRGALLYTSRTAYSIQREEDRTIIHVREVHRRGDAACGMLRSAASMEKEDELPPAALELLDICAGLPLAITIVGSLRRVRRGRPPMWQDILKRMKSARSRSEALRFNPGHNSAFGYPQHMGLGDAFEVSLESLETSTDDVEKGAFQVVWFYEDQWVTQEGAGRIWGLDSLQTSNVLQCLAARSLIELDDDNSSKAHDCMRDYLKREAKEKERASLLYLHAQILWSGLEDPKIVTRKGWLSPYRTTLLLGQGGFFFHLKELFFDNKWWDMVRELRLNGHRDEVVEALAATLPQSKALQSIDLSHINIVDEGAKALAAALPRRNALQSLDLSVNNIGNEGAKALAAAFPQCKALQSLVPAFNHIHYKGATALAAALPQYKALQYLDLSWNKIGDEGAKALAAAKALQYLDLSWNKIGDEGAKALAAALLPIRWR